MRHATSDEDRREGARQEARAAAAPGPRWLRLGLTLALGLAAGATLFPRKARGGAGDGARER
jgi:hypothetical protein